MDLAKFILLNWLFTCHRSLFQYMVDGSNYRIGVIGSENASTITPIHGNIQKTNPFLDSYENKWKETEYVK